MPPIRDVNYIMMVRPSGGAERAVLARGVSANYFDVLGIRIVSGRVFVEGSGSLEVVVNRLAARRLWPEASPIGQTITDTMGADRGTVYHVVGVVDDVPVRTIDRREPVIYRGVSASASGVLAIVHDPRPAAVDAIRRVVGAVHAGVTVRWRPLTDYVRESLTVTIVSSRVAQAIGALGLLLASIGAFGVFAFGVEERRREIGIRLALGASARQIVRLVLSTTRWSLFTGLGIGFGVAAAAAPLAASYLYGLSPYDPLAYAGIALILAAAAVGATWIPARRALRVDPSVTLRAE
jgi:hypothetical protein